MEWHVQLKGHGLDLQELSKCLTTPALLIRKSGGNYILQSSSFDALEDPDAVSDAAAAVLALIYGAARLGFGVERPITVSGIIEIRDGRRIFHEALSDGFEFRAAMSMQITHGDGRVEIHLPAEKVPDWVAMAQRDRHVAKVLRLLGPGINSFAELYKIYEVVEHDVGGRVWRAGWASEADVRRFKHTANSPEALGDLARHGAETTDPPKAPLSRHEASALVQKVVLAWLAEKEASAKAPDQGPQETG